MPMVSSARAGAELIARVVPYIAYAKAIQFGLQESLGRVQRGPSPVKGDVSAENRAYAIDVSVRFNQCVTMAEQLTYVLQELAASMPADEESTSKVAAHDPSRTYGNR
jgi:hypothetical protein